MLETLRKTWATHTPFKKIGNYIDKNAQAVGGGMALASSSALAFSGDTNSLAAAGTAMGGYLCFVFGRETTASYSLASLTFVGSNMLLFNSPAVEGNESLKLTLLALAAGWTAGAARWPVEKIGEHLPKLKNAAITTSKAILKSNTANSVFWKAPLTAAAFAGDQDYIGAAGSISLAKDFLIGRIHEDIRNVFPRTNDVQIHHGPNTFSSNGVLYISQDFLTEISDLTHPEQDVTDPQSHP